MIIGCAGVLCLALTLSGWLGGYRVNTTPSYPLGLWRIDMPDRPVQVGDRIFICPPDTPMFRQALRRGYLRFGLCKGGFGPMIKTVLATGGQTFCVRDRVRIDGRQVDHSVVARVDGAGRQLTAYGGGIVPEQDLFLYSAFKGSYDSRYFGPISRTGVLGFAREVLTDVP